MPLVGRRGVLALEDVPEMASAFGAHDLDPLHAEASVHLDADGVRVALVEGRPAAARVKPAIASSFKTMVRLEAGGASRGSGGGEDGGGS